MPKSPNHKSTQPPTGKSAFNRIIWAVDPFSEDQRLQLKAAEALTALTAGQQAVIEPIHVLRPQQLNLSIEFYPGWIEQYRVSAEKALGLFLKSLSIPGLLPPRILMQDSSSLRETVETLNKYALENNYDLITVSTHANKGVARLLLGSFAETLVLYSKFPVLVVNPAMAAVKKLDHILFPTDFSACSKEAFGAAVKLAQNLKAAITIYHRIDPSMSPDPEAETTIRKNDADNWASIADAQGIRTHCDVEAIKGNTAQAILAKADKTGGLIAMAAQSGPIASVVLGSVARQVIRGSTRPVWVVHPSVQEERVPDLDEETLTSR